MIYGIWYMVYGIPVWYVCTTSVEVVQQIISLNLSFYRPTCTTMRADVSILPATLFTCACSFVNLGSVRAECQSTPAAPVFASSSASPASLPGLKGLRKKERTRRGAIFDHSPSDLWATSSANEMSISSWQWVFFSFSDLTL